MQAKINLCVYIFVAYNFVDKNTHKIYKNLNSTKINTHAVVRLSLKENISVMYVKFCLIMVRGILKCLIKYKMVVCLSADAIF